MRKDWVEEAWDTEGGLEFVEASSRGAYYMWFAYKGRPYFYVAEGGRLFRQPSRTVFDDKEILNYARTLWELSR